MFVDSSPVTAHRSPDTPRVRGAFRKATPRTAGAAARRTRLDDAIVSQWLLEQVPSDHRPARGWSRPGPKSRRSTPRG
jgi:hypothetical protein